MRAPLLAEWLTKRAEAELEHQLADPLEEDVPQSRQDEFEDEFEQRSSVVIDVRITSWVRRPRLPPSRRGRQLRADVRGNQARNAKEAKDD